MPISFLKRLVRKKTINSPDVVAKRFCQIFQDHGVEKSQIPRLMPPIKLGDLKSNEALLATLTPDILDKTAHLFGIRVEWLEGVDDEIYEYRHCYKVPEFFFERLATVRSRANFERTRVPVRVLCSSKNLDCKTNREQILVPVLLERIAELGGECIYRYTIFNDGFDWGYEPGRIQLKAMARMVYKALHTPVPLMIITSAELQSVLDRKKVPREALDGCLVTNPSLEDFALTSRESGVATEVDEMPSVFKYIKDHKLENLLTNDPPLASLPQDSTPETHQSPVPPASATIAPETGKRANNALQLWEPAKAVASALWAEDDSLLIAEVIRRIQKMPHLKAAALSASAIHKNIAKLAPGKDSGKPGRRPKKST